MQHEDKKSLWRNLWEGGLYSVPSPLFPLHSWTNLAYSYMLVVREVKINNDELSRTWNVEGNKTRRVLCQKSTFKSCVSVISIPGLGRGDNMIEARALNVSCQLLDTNKSRYLKYSSTHRHQLQCYPPCGPQVTSTMRCPPSLARVPSLTGASYLYWGCDMRPSAGTGYT